MPAPPRNLRDPPGTDAFPEVMSDRLSKLKAAEDEDADEALALEDCWLAVTKSPGEVGWSLQHISLDLSQPDACERKILELKNRFVLKRVIVL